MRLLNVHDFNLESGFPDQGISTLWSQENSTIPRYAILSHRWIDEEITFDKLATISKDRFSQTNTPNQPISPSQPTNSNSNPNSPNSDKYASSIYKIAGACEQVRESNERGDVRHIWIDTVCIDKSDAQELSIAINSMFRWYENAEVCYVYMYDVCWNGADETEISREQFRKSEWFNRGWTLQELLAPKKLEFFDRDWKYIGSKEELVEDISKAANISREHLLTNFRTASLAQKMSWLAKRKTKYPEDLSYCMLGILGVDNLEGLYMEARYSQGTNEFQRLQREMIKKWNPLIPFDESLFAWKEDRIATSGLLAPAPRCFKECGNIMFDPGLAKLRLRPVQLGGWPETGKNNGISFDEANNMNFVTQWILPVPIAGVLFFATFGLLAWITLVPEKGRQKLIRHRDVTLNCWVRGRDGQLGVQKIKMEKKGDGTWQRVDCGTVLTSSWSRIYPTRFLAASYPAPLRITSSPAQEKR